MKPKSFPAITLRCRRPLALAITLLCQATTHADQRQIATFTNKESLQSWRSVNDSVMGGISKGGFTLSDSQTLLFRGELSLENNGGFASIRTEDKKLNLKDMTSLVIKARGDGRTYWVDLREGSQMGASSYRAYMPTKAGEWIEAKIPVADFKLQAFGRQIPSSKPIKLSAVSSLGFTIADKKAGQFSLEVQSITASDDEGKQAAPAAVSNENTIVDVAKAAGKFKTLLTAATAADLAGVLASKGPFTVFAPTDEAFQKLPKGTVETLLKPENRDALVAVLKNHVVSGKVSLAKALELGKGDSLLGTKLEFAFTDGRVRISSANLLSADISASNGVIHVIDQVLVPKLPEAKPVSPAALIELAIDRGVPLFNDGEEGACAAIYEIACEAVRSNEKVSKEIRSMLAKVITEARAESSAKKQAWILRDGLDQAWKSLE